MIKLDFTILGNAVVFVTGMSINCRLSSKVWMGPVHITNSLYFSHGCMLVRTEDSEFGKLHLV